MTQPPEAAPAPRKSDLIPRLITALVGIPILLAILFLAPSWAFAAVVAFAVAASAWEYVSITSAPQPARGPQVVVTALAVATSAVMLLTSSPEQGIDGTILALTLAGATVLIFWTYLATFKDVTRVSGHIGAGATSLVYCAVMPTFLALLHRDAGDDGPWWVILSFAIVWGSDTGAYFAGRAFGKHKLAPRVSPKKTVEGAVGGLIASIVAVVVFKFTALPNLQLWHIFALAIPANILGQSGDLAESVIKRAHDVKDSGTIIYGHGGMLDRIDAVIFAVPWIYAFFRFLY